MLWHWPQRLERFEVRARNESGEPRDLKASVLAFVPTRKWKLPEENPGYSGPGPANRMEWGNDNTIAKFAPVGNARARRRLRFAPSGLCNSLS